MNHLEGFHGSVEWIHEWEGHAGKPYHPGGDSGVTLDPGLDIGWAGPDLVEAYFERLPASRAVTGAVGLDHELRGVRRRRRAEGRLILEQSIGEVRTRLFDALWDTLGPYE